MEKQKENKMFDSIDDILSSMGLEGPMDIPEDIDFVSFLVEDLNTFLAYMVDCESKEEFNVLRTFALRIATKIFDLYEKNYK